MLGENLGHSIEGRNRKGARLCEGLERVLQKGQWSPHGTSESREGRINSAVWN